MKRKQLLLALLVAVFVVGTVGVPAAQAKTKDTNNTVNTTNNDRPGWGFGDDHHHHVGPPGHSVFPSVRPGDTDGDRDDHHTFSPAQIHQFITAFQHFLRSFFG